MAPETTSRGASYIGCVVALVALVALACGTPSCTSKSGTATPTDAAAMQVSDSSPATRGTGGRGTGGVPGDAHTAVSSGGGASPLDASPDAPSEQPDGARHFSTDRSTFFGPTRCARANVKLCEDFESGTLDASTWTIQGDTPTIDGVQTARGTHALHILKKDDGSSFIREKKTFPELSHEYWGRLFVYFEQLPAAPMTYAHWTIIAASGTGVSGEIRVSGQFSSGNNLFGVGTDNRTDANGTGDWTQSDNDPKGNPKPVPLHQWLCLEWMHSQATNETRFFLDGVEHPSLHTTKTMNGGNGMPFLLPEFTNVWVGWWEYQTSTETFELWMDEVAIDSTRIGCEI